MAMVVDCECGQQVRAESEDELVAKVYEHIDGNHPDLVGKLSREDVVAMASEE
jgi:predicted small metal-binding protein